jgi:dTDP-D-glucose 4,6-dehydratase
VISLKKQILSDRPYDLILKYLPDRPFDVKRNILDNSRIVATTGIQPVTDLRSGISQTCTWVQEYMSAKYHSPTKS